MCLDASWMERYHWFHDWCLRRDDGVPSFSDSGPEMVSSGGTGGAPLPQGFEELLPGGAGLPVVGVSACLLGIPSRYDGASKPVAGLGSRLASVGLDVIPVCPEVLAELGAPRPAMCFEGGDGGDLLDGTADLLDTEGRSCQEAMRKGSARAMALVRGACALLLKERSPSCGLRTVDVDGAMVPGKGVFAAMASREGMALFSEEDLGEFFRFVAGCRGRGTGAR